MLLGLSKIELGISILLLIYILGNFSTPVVIMRTFKTPYAAMTMFILLVLLFIYGNVTVLLLYVFALYELMKRSDIDKYDTSVFVEEVYGDELRDIAEQEENEGQEGFQNNEGDTTEDTYDILRDALDEQDIVKEHFQNQDIPLLLSDPSDPLPEDGIGNENELNPEMIQNIIAASEQNNAMNDAQVVEEFTSLLGKGSLEKNLIDQVSPIGKGSVIKYKSTPYKPLGTNLTGASLI
jgi:hypothetical protein